MEAQEVHQLGDVPADSLEEAIPHRKAKDTAHFYVEYGVRRDDDAMVFHFYSSKEHALGVLEGGRVDGTLWPASYDITARLERGIVKNFAIDCVRATYSGELDSYCIIVQDLGKSLDPWLLVERFLSGIDDPLEA